MFGAPKFGSPFGQNQQQSTFGKPAFGATNFGQPTSIFTQPTTSVFGQQPAAPTFGATAPAFGQTATTQSAFGSFGQQQQQQQQQQPTTSLFGQSQVAQPSTSLFGQPSTSTGFGVPKSTGFGFNTNQGSLFGQPSTSTTNTGFGTFGNTGTSAFSSPQTMNANGTAIAKFQPHNGTDTLMKNGQTNTVNTRQYCITAMKEYEGKSLEELRLEDYLANRKGPQAGSVQGGGLFGSTQQNTGIFGVPASQPQSTGLFGAQAPTNTLGGFGANTNTFGAAAPAFGAQNQATSLFNKPANTFGQSTFNQQPASNLFGAKPFGAPTTTAATGFAGFGAPAANTTAPFGAAKPFGQPTTGLFGSTAPAATGAPGFGANTTSFGGGGFGTPAPATSQPSTLFGQPTNTGSTLFGGLASSAPNTGFGGFGSTTNTAAGGLFGAQKPATGFGSTFGAPASSATTGFSGLGTFTPAGGSAFGTFGQTSTFAKPAGTGFTGFGATSTAPTLSAGFGGLGTNTLGFGGGPTSLQPAQQTTVPVHQHILSLATSPYGDNPIFKDLKPLGSLNEDALKPTNPAAQKAILESSNNQYKISPKVSNGLKIKPVTSTLSKKSLFGGLEEFDSSIEESFSLKPNAKRLIIKPKVSTPTTLASNPNSTSISVARSQETSQVDSVERRSTQLPATSSEIDNARRVSWLHSNFDKVPQQNRGDLEANSTIQDLVSSGKSKSSSMDKQSSSPGILRQDLNRANISTMQHKSVHFPGLNANDSILSTKSFLDDTNADISLINTEPHPTGIVLQRSGYYTIPPLDKLTDFMTEDGKCIVPNFTVGRKGYGNVYFGEPIDVAGLNLDELVHFRHKEVIIYPDDENKPPVGEGLNRKAQITLDQVWPHDKTMHEPIKDRERLDEMNYESKLRAVCDKHDTRFVEYRPETGSWVFKVDHFSKYGLTDSDEEDGAADAKKAKPNQPGKDGLKTKLSGAIPKTSLKDTALQRDPMYSNHKSPRLSAFNDLADDREMEYMNFMTPYGQYPGQAMSPSTDLAMDMGTDPTKVQVMRASFFNTIDDDADEYESKSVTYEHYGDRDSPDQIVPNKRLFTFSSTHSMLSKEVSSTTSSSSIETPILSPQLPIIREEPKKGELLTEAKKLISAKTFKPIPLVLKPKIASIRASNKIVPLCESIQAKLQNTSIASDVALYHGRRFRVGWTHANSLTILTTSMIGKNLNRPTNLTDISALFGGRSPTDTSKSIVKQLKIFSFQSKDESAFELSIQNHLKCQLKFSQRIAIDDSDCPQLGSINGIEALQQHYQLAEQNYAAVSTDDFQQISLNVWSLLVTLWGYQDELDEVTNDDHFAIMLRRDLFSKWIEDTVTDKNLLKRTESQGRYLQNLLNLLTAHKVNEACELAFNNGDMNLSLLLAQTGGGKVVRALVAKQLHSWRETEADKFVDVHRLKAMMLVAGMPTYESSRGLVNIYENLDWLKSLAISVWYLCSPTASITDALLKYDDATEVNACAPKPSYIKNNAGSNMDRIQDIRYHILKLYSKRSHSLEKLLNPATHTSDFMDFRLSWLLLQVLKSIGYQHCSEQSEAQLHVSFASQLENYGLWHWSIFVLLHIPNKSQRELAIQQILYRYIDLTKNERYRAKESFIVNELGIPEKWIYWAKAVKAGSLKQYREQADYLLKAKQWALAHEVIMREIAPDAIINDNTRYIKDLLDRFEDPRLVPNWSNQGMIILDYLDMITKIESLKTIHERDIETRWEGLKPQLSELCSRINQFPCPTSKHRLCQSEIAQGLAILVNGMEILSQDINPCLLVQTALEKLPLPEEYAKQKMRSLLDNSNLIEMLQNDEN